MIRIKVDFKLKHWIVENIYEQHSRITYLNVYAYLIGGGMGGYSGGGYGGSSGGGGYGGSSGGIEMKQIIDE